MKKRSKVLMVSAVVVAASMFTVTALASSPNTAGYEAFKEVVKANQMSGEKFESATVDGGFSLTVDGETVLKADGTTKVADADGEHSVSSDFDFTLMGVERSGSLYNSDEDSVYLVDRTHDLHYQVINLDDEHESKHDEWVDEEGFDHRPMNRAEEALLDFVVGDLKDDFSVTNHEDGSKTIVVDITEEEIPLPLRLLMDVASSVDKGEHNPAEEVSAELERLKQLPFFQGLDEVSLEEQMPELTEDVTIERVQLQLTVDANNDLLGLQGELEVSGKDEAGDAHRVEIEGAGDFSGFNTTTPDVYDPTGKSVELIDADTFEDRD